MSLMSFREYNRAKWIGVRPGHNGIQIVANGAGVVDETTVIHTVSASKVLYITSWWLSCFASAAGTANFFINDTDPALFYRICRFEDDGAFCLALSGNFWPPLEVSSSYTVSIHSNSADLEAAGGFVGWEE